jgi:hypothetical protein
MFQGITRGNLSERLRLLSTADWKSNGDSLCSALLRRPIVSYRILRLEVFCDTEVHPSTMKSRCPHILARLGCPTHQHPHWRGLE